MHAVVCCFFLLVTVDRTLAKPQIVSSPDDVTVYTGQAVMFRCQVNDPQNSLMSWSSVTHNVTICQGSRLLVQDNRYSVMRVAGGQQYLLQILDVQKSDEGFYKCAIEGTDQQLISQLHVLDMPTEKPIDRPTDGPTGRPTDGPTDRATDRTTVRTTDRTTVRTTDRTTERPSTFLPGTPPEIQTATTQPKTQITTSLPETATTTSYSLPDRPTGLMVIKADGAADVLLTWDVEQKTFDTRFTVFYKALGEVQYTVVSNIATTYYHMTNLKPRTFYTAYVVANRSDYKNSPPSTQVLFASGTNDVPNDNKDKTSDSDPDSELILGIGIGVTVAAVILIMMVLLVVCFICRGRMKESITLANPDFTGPKAAIEALQISTIKT